MRIGTCAAETIRSESGGSTLTTGSKSLETCLVKWCHWAMIIRIIIISCSDQMCTQCPTRVHSPLYIVVYRACTVPYSFVCIYK